MSQQPIRLVVAYFGLATLYGALHVLATPSASDWRWAVIVGSAIGWMIAPLLLGGIIPFALWIFGRSRGDLLVAWGIIGLVIASAATAEEFYEGKLSPGNIPANVSAFFSNDYETFVRVVKTSCVDSRQPNATRPAGLSDQAFAAFCQCYAEAMLKELTVAELRFTLKARTLPNPRPLWMQEKMGRAAIACQRFAVSP